MIRFFLFALFLNAEICRGTVPEEILTDLQAEKSGSKAEKADNGFTLTKTHDSLYFLNDWRLPYHVYRFCTGDVNGDGKAEALVGVIKSTRFYPEKARRIFIFKLVNGKKVRPLWLGSKLGGILKDFRYVNGRVRSLEASSDSLYSVADWQWNDFGLKFERFLIHRTDKATATRIFHQQE
jgi:hypothetical protein